MIKGELEMKGGSGATSTVLLKVRFGISGLLRTSKSNRIRPVHPNPLRIFFGVNTNFSAAIRDLYVEITFPHTTLSSFGTVM